MPVTQQITPEEALAEARQLFERANSLRLSDPQTERTSPQAKKVIDDARQWLNRALTLLPTLSPARALHFIQPLDLIHRVANSAPLPPAISTPVILAALRAHIDGDPQISAYDLFPHINDQLLNQNPDFAGAPLSWHSRCITLWLRNIQSPARRRRLSPADLRTQATLLHSADLWPYLPNQSAFKSTLPLYNGKI